MDPKYIERFEAYLDEVKETYQAQGLVIGLFSHDRLLYYKTLGYRDVANRQPITQNTIFGIASITKSFTTIGLLQLAEEGLIDLAQPISTAFKNWTLSAEHTPKVSHLLSHTGGFYPQERFLMNDFARKLNLIEGQDNLATHEALAIEGAEAIVKRLNEATSFTGRPGENMSYSNFGYGLITDLIRRHSSYSSYAEAIETKIVLPLGLKNTFFDFSRPHAEENMTVLYEVKDDQVIATSDYTDLGFVLIGGGGLKSTFNDMMTYTRMLMNKGTINNIEILSPLWISEMEKERVSYRPGQGYGFGLMTEQVEHLKMIGHSGGLTGVSSFFGYSKDSNIGVVVLCNTGGIPARSIGISALRMAHDLYPSHRLRDYPVGSWSQETLNNTVGLYESEEGDTLIISETEGIMVLSNGQRTFDYSIVDDDVLLIRDRMEESHCRILRTPEGKAWGLYRGLRILPRKTCE